MDLFLEIICIGNELLIGKTMNTNAFWLAKKIADLGLRVKRITVVSDDVNQIADVIRESLQRKPSYILTTGGLGPTFDDKTLEGIAIGLGKKLEENSVALGMIKKKYERYVADKKIEKLELTPHRVKMSILPEGGKPLINPIGTAPGVLIKYEDSTLVILPGVPEEMKAIFNESILPNLQKITDNLAYFEALFDVRGIAESSLAPIIDKVMSENPSIYIKSHPKASEKKHHLELHLSTIQGNSTIAQTKLTKAIIQLSDVIQQEGATIKPLKNKLETPINKLIKESK